MLVHHLRKYSNALAALLDWKDGAALSSRAERCGAVKLTLSSLPLGPITSLFAQILLALFLPIIIDGYRTIQKEFKMEQIMYRALVLSFDGRKHGGETLSADLDVVRPPPKKAPTGSSGGQEGRDSSSVVGALASSQAVFRGLFSQRQNHMNVSRLLSVALRALPVILLRFRSDHAILVVRDLMLYASPAARPVS